MVLLQEVFLHDEILCREKSNISLDYEIIFVVNLLEMFASTRDAYKENGKSMYVFEK